MTSSDIKQALKNHFYYRYVDTQKKSFRLFFEVKTGRTWYVNDWKDRKPYYKLDAVAVKTSWSKPELRGYEIKVSRSDFLRDKKWPNYLAYCNKFYFICPTDLIKKEELPDGVGLIYVNNKLNIRTIVSSEIREHVNKDIYQYLVISRCAHVLEKEEL